MAGWARRCRELIDNYQPDLVYFDNFDLPFEQAGLDIAAYYYNANRRWHGGRLEGVLTVKTTPPQRRMALVDDVERGGKTYIESYAWQTDTCLGNWHYDRALYERDGYKSAATVVHTLCDVVSKNGNLLLNVPMRGDGTIDEKAERIVEGSPPGWAAMARRSTDPDRGACMARGPVRPAAACSARRRSRNIPPGTFAMSARARRSTPWSSVARGRGGAADPAGERQHDRAR
ncbi:alpha-L-fucosidase [Sphingomonas sp. I4]